MFALYVMEVCASIQANRGGVGGYFKPNDLTVELGMSRSTAHRHINYLLKRGTIIKTSYGRYQLAITKELVAIGLCVLTPHDIYLYSSGYSLDDMMEKVIVQS